MGKLVVLGSARSGLGAAKLARQKNWEVLVSDSQSISQESKDVLSRIGASFEEQGHSAAVMQADLVVKSPGIPDTVPLVKRLREQGISVISEIEFAYRYTQATIVAVTGSNGKTTTAMLTHHVLQRAGMDVVLAGNIGRSFAEALSERDPAVFVLELSSFQLDGIVDFRPHIAILLNITPDHLDRYEYSLDRYADSKFRIGMNQLSSDFFIYHQDDPIIQKGFERNPISAELLPFSTEHILKQGAWIEDEHIHTNTHYTLKLNTIMSIYKLALQGRHNLYNSMAAGMAGRVLDVRSELLRDSLSDFKNVEHRLEFLGKINGVEYINDSKATNVNATWYALESMKNEVVWVVGGVDKGNDYTQLFDLVTDKVKAIVCLGTDNSKIIEAFKDKVEFIYETNSAAQAVRTSSLIARNGDTVLLSPCCASFDLFEDYEERGRLFKKAVRSL